MKPILYAAALLLAGCGTYQGGCDISEPSPIYKYDPESGEYRRDRRMERVREQGARDGSADSGPTVCQ
ncbi:Uncharacterised protein [Leminorella richardii]|uniref:Lipoprotein n=1 Tax=Leminorella richardii TaxID=158841 RepID=A0A2X4UE97_9GAMM|nr:hypothetical protein [Leminorella richardii]SQI36989.1 Uncharacterised protein [Leminorella richardii]